MGTFARRPRRLGRLTALVAVVAALVLGTSAVSAALVSGSLPTAGLTYTSVTQNAVNMAGDAIRLKIKDNVTVKTTYSIVTPANQLVGSWHYHHGPVIVTVTAGTLTFIGAGCETWDVSAGQSYIESAGQVLIAKAVTAKNTGNIEWFTTRLYPEGAVDPQPVDAPCTPA
jgi:quercetin dioxygenase-like cupin family protein